MPDSAETSTFGSLLRQHRLTAGLTQAVLAERAGIAERTIQDLERGIVRPRRATIRRLVTALALPPEARSRLEAVSPAPRPMARRGAPETRAAGLDGPVDARQKRLPIPPTALLGREHEFAEIRAILDGATRLVTLTGPGGVGKTRLGVQAAAELLDEFDDGVFLVELAPLADPGLVPSTIAQALSVRDLRGRTPLEGVREYLRTRRVLLVLDNFEQILAAAPVVVDLLATSPDLKVLVTSREPLRVRGEREYAVPPLAIPDSRQRPSRDTLSGYAAVALFLERAGAIRADFAVTEENADAIAEICIRLDGLPLAIELAAARTRLLTPVTMAARLERRLPLLTGGARDLPARQRTLRNTIDWSHDLLDEGDRRLFRRLAVFRGGWTLEAAEAVCDAGDLDVDVLDGLESLVSKNLVRRHEDVDGEARFRMLETVREYASERLDAYDEAAQLRRRHAHYCLWLAERAAPELHTPEQGAWLNRLEAEHDNMRAALAWIIEQEEADLGLRLGGALTHFWNACGHHAEGRARLAEVLQSAGTRAHPASRAKVLRELGFLTNDQGDFAASRALIEESLAIMREQGDKHGVARALIGLAWIANDEGDFSLGSTLHEESLSIMRELGDGRGIAIALNGLGFIASIQRDHAAARACHEESLAIMRALGDRHGVARALIGLGWVGIDQQDHVGARGLLAESLAIAHELSFPRIVIDGLETFAYLAVSVDRMDHAARLQGAAEALRETIGVPLTTMERTLYDPAAVRATPGLAAAWAEGRSMTEEQAVAYALDAVGSLSRGGVEVAPTSQHP